MLFKKVLANFIVYKNACFILKGLFEELLGTNRQSATKCSFSTGLIVQKSVALLFEKLSKSANQESSIKIHNSLQE